MSYTGSIKSPLEHYLYIVVNLLGSNYCIKIVRNVCILSIAVQNTTRQRITQHYTLFTEEVYLITITRVRPQRIDAITVTARDYRTTSTPLNELTAATTNFNYVRLTITLAEIYKQERVRHQRFTCNRVQLTEHLHIVKHCTTLNGKFDTVCHLIRCKLTTKGQLLTRACYEFRINQSKACSLLTKNAVKFTNRLCLIQFAKLN